jgi:hypothetical protein
MILHDARHGLSEAERSFREFREHAAKHPLYSYPGCSRRATEYRRTKGVFSPGRCKDDDGAAPPPATPATRSSPAKTAAPRQGAEFRGRGLSAAARAVLATTPDHITGLRRWG